MSLKYRKALDNILAYAPAKTIEEIERELGIDKIIRLSANENSLGYSPLVKEAIEGSFNKINLYPDFNCTKLRKKLSEVYGFDEKKLIFGNGSFELLSLVGDAFINTNEESIIPEPSFGWYKVVTLKAEGKIVSVPLKNHGIDLDDVKNKINEKTKVIWLCNPNNPTGTYFSEEKLVNFLEQVPSHIIVVLDEAYYEFVNSNNYPNSVKLLEKFKNIIILRTFSKVYGLASLRIGYGITSEEIITVLNKIRLPINVNYIAQVAAYASLEDQEFRNKVYLNNLEGKQIFYKAFDELDLEYIPTQTNFIMVDVKKNSLEVFNEVLKRGISIRAGIEFGMKTWLRITIGTPEENKLLVDILKEVLSNNF